MKQHVLPGLDLGLKVKTLPAERELSEEEFLGMFERKESLALAYIPHFLTQCVMYYLDLLLEYCRTHKLPQYKKCSRVLKMVRDEYEVSIRHEMPPHIYARFLEQREEFFALCGVNLTLMYYTFSNELSRKYGKIPHEEVLCYAAIMEALVVYVEHFDREVNAEIARRMGMPCRNHGDARLTAIKSVSKFILKDYAMPCNQQTETCVNVIVSKAKIMINNMLN